MVESYRLRVYVCEFPRDQALSGAGGSSVYFLSHPVDRGGIDRGWSLGYNLGFESSCLKEASGGRGHMPCCLEVPTLAPKTQDLGSDFLAPPVTRGPL